MAIYERISDVPRRRYRVRSPVTLEPIGEFESASADEVRAAVERARKAQAGWAELSVKQRAEYMWRLLDQFGKRQDETIDAVLAETGKARSLLRRQNCALQRSQGKRADACVKLWNSCFRRAASLLERTREPALHF